MPNTLISQLVPWEGASYLYTWNPINNTSDIEPVTHIECVIFNDTGQILVMNEYDRWSIPGGAPVKDESYEHAILREVREEVNILVRNLKFIGYQKIERQDKQENTFYHLVYTAIVKELQPREADPEAGIVHPTKFVKSTEITKYVKWGTTGIAMFNEAIVTFNKG